MSTVSKITFGESSFKNHSLSERHRKRPMLSSISQMTDDEIIQASVRNANKEANNSKAARVLKNGPIMFLAASSLAYGALKSGKLSDKVAGAAKMFGVTSFIYALSKPVTDVVTSVFNKDGEKPSNGKLVLETLGSIGLITASAMLGVKGAKKGTEFLAKKFAPTAEFIKNGLKNTANKIDNSKAGKLTETLTEKMNFFSKLHPKSAEALKSFAYIFPAAAYVGGSISLNNKIVDDRDKKAVQNMNQLALCREFAKAALDKKDN